MTSVGEPGPADLLADRRSNSPTEREKSPVVVTPPREAQLKDTDAIQPGTPPYKQTRATLEEDEISGLSTRPQLWGERVSCTIDGKFPPPPSALSHSWEPDSTNFGKSRTHRTNSFDHCAAIF